MHGNEIQSCSQHSNISQKIQINKTFDQQEAPLSLQENLPFSARLAPTHPLIGICEE